VRCQANKLSKQTRISKGLVLGAGAVAVRWWCGAKQRLGAVRWWVLCWCKVRAYLKARFRCLVPVLGGGAKRISKARVRVYPSKGLVWFGAVLSAIVGCKVKVLG